MGKRLVTGGHEFEGKSQRGIREGGGKERKKDRKKGGGRRE